MLETVICTISDEGTKTKNELVENTLLKLSRMKSSKVKVIGIHMGDDEKLNGLISRYCPGVQIIPFPSKNPLQRMKKGMENLFTNAKRIVGEAALENPKSILYMEGDKNNFVSLVPEVVYSILDDSADVVIPSRTLKDFSKFPISQVIWENWANKEVTKIVGTKMDRMYGPRAWNLKCSKYFSECPLNDFSALTYSVVRAELEKNRIFEIRMTSGEPQEDYLQKYPSIVRLPFMHFLYRALQNRPHKYAAKLAKLQSKK